MRARCGYFLQFSVLEQSIVGTTLSALNYPTEFFTPTGQGKILRVAASFFSHHDSMPQLHTCLRSSSNSASYSASRSAWVARASGGMLLKADLASQ